MKKILKWILYGLITILIFAIQAVLGNRIKMFGIKPNLMPFLIAAIAVLEGPKPGAWYGFFTGLICDAFHPVSVGFFPVLYFLAAFGIGYIVELYFSRSYASAIIFGAAVSILSNLMQYFVFHMIFDNVGALDMLYIAAAELLYSALLSAFAYFPLRLACYMTENREKYRKRRY